MGPDGQPRHGSLEFRAEEMKDLEEQTAEDGRHPVGVPRRAHLRRLLDRGPSPFEWGTTPEGDAEPKPQPSNSSGDTILLQKN